MNPILYFSSFKSYIVLNELNILLSKISINNTFSAYDKDSYIELILVLLNE